MVRLTFVFPSHQYMFVKSEITGRQMLKILKKQAMSNFNWNKTFENLTIDEKVVLFN